MRLAGIICLVAMLIACGVTPKDYSAATRLGPIDTQLAIKPLWVVKTGDVPEYAHAQLPPVVMDGNVSVANIAGEVSLLSGLNGKLIWRHNLNEPITGGPGIGEELLYVGTQGAEIVALDKKDGTERWRTSVPSEMLSKPLVVKNSIYVQTIDGKISSINAKTGSLNWVYSHDTPKLTLRGTTSPIMIGSQVVSGFADGKLVSLSASTGEKNWETTIVTPHGRTDLERIADIDGELQAHDGIIYVIGYQGRIAAVSSLNGSVQWSRKMSSYNGLSINNGQIFLGDIDGQIWALDARTGATLWKQNKLMGREISTPVVVNSTVAVADFDGYVHWLSMADGQLVARQSLGELWEENYPTTYDSIYDELESKKIHRLVSTKPIVLNETLIVRDNEGALAALRMGKREK